MRIETLKIKPTTNILKIYIYTIELKIYLLVTF